MPAIPTLAFALMVAGGLWCALWGTRWRLLGVLPIALGLMLAPTAQRPDVLVGRNAGLVAVRGSDGRLSALAGRGSGYELARWLEHDGDGRSAAEAAGTSAFRCDRLGCIAEVKGMRLAVARSAAALRDDCIAAPILVLAFAKPARCRPAGVAIDTGDLSARGAYALTIGNGRVRIETVADARGDRPWAANAGQPGSPLSAPADWDEDQRPPRTWRDR